MSSFWGAWIIVLTVVTIVGIVWLLFATRKLKVESQDNTSGHIYDGIVEDDNPLPAWWFNMFMISVIFGVGYLLFYPGLGNYRGILDWTSTGQLEREAAKVEAQFSASTSEFADLSIEELTQKPAALAMGRRLYANNCSVCHGSDAKGGEGFPDLVDSEWQWGNSIDQITQSITHGRQAAMPAWKDVLSVRQINAVAEFIALMPGAGDAGKAETGDSALQGQQAYQTYCVACHSADGSGNVLLGAPALNDDVWLYGGSSTQIYASIEHGRNGQMPAHKSLLSDSRIRLIVAYLLNLAGDPELVDE